MTNSTQTILEILKLSTTYLEKNQLPSPRLEAELLISYVLKCKRLDLYLRFDQPLQSIELDKIRSLLKRRANHEPIQYILGETYFYDCKFKTDHRALIPRSDTETLVEEVIRMAKCISEPQILDVGTGSGCIAITLAKNINTKKIAALDFSSEALELARENADLNGVNSKIIFAVCDILQPFKVKEKFDILVSNPPYISKSEMNDIDKEVKSFEPQIALTDGVDGLNFYRRLAEISPSTLKSGGWLVVEIGHKQGDSVQQIFADRGLKQISVIKDLSGNDRVVKGQVIN